MQVPGSLHFGLDCSLEDFVGPVRIHCILDVIDPNTALDAQELALHSSKALATRPLSITLRTHLTSAQCMYSVRA
jgi:hypothetical protein